MAVVSEVGWPTALRGAVAHGEHPWVGRYRGAHPV